MKILLFIILSNKKSYLNKNITNFGTFTSNSGAGRPGAEHLTLSFFSFLLYELSIYHIRDFKTSQIVFIYQGYHCVGWAKKFFWCY